jgi:hypothetical protein
MWKHLWPTTKKYIDRNKERAKQEILEALPDLIEYGTEDDLIELVKTWNPNISVDELQAIINDFRAAKSARVR